MTFIWHDHVCINAKNFKLNGFYIVILEISRWLIINAISADGMKKCNVICGWSIVNNSYVGRISFAKWEIIGCLAAFVLGNTCYMHLSFTVKFFLFFSEEAFMYSAHACMCAEQKSRYYCRRRQQCKAKKSSTNTVCLSTYTVNLYYNRMDSREFLRCDSQPANERKIISGKSFEIRLNVV